jgi:hypothetical protein
MRVSPLALGLAALMLSSAGISRSASAPRPLAPKSTQSCLLRHKVTNGIVATSKLGSLVAPGVVSSIHAYFPPAPVGGDDATLWFFSSPSLAVKGEAKMVREWVVGDAFPGLPKPPAAAVPSLHRRYLNVVVTWQFPRR